MKIYNITKKSLLFILILIFLIPIEVFGAQEESVQAVSKDKIWSVNFNEVILLDEITKENVYILDDTGKKVDITLELNNDGKTLLVKPPKQGYEAGKTYLLEITEQVHNAAYKI
jgi:hypothetical protein